MLGKSDIGRPLGQQATCWGWPPAPGVDFNPKKKTTRTESTRNKHKLACQIEFFEVAGGDFHLWTFFFFGFFFMSESEAGIGTDDSGR